MPKLEEPLESLFQHLHFVDEQTGPMRMRSKSPKSQWELKVEPEQDPRSPYFQSRTPPLQLATSCLINLAQGSPHSCSQVSELGLHGTYEHHVSSLSPRGTTENLSGWTHVGQKSGCLLSQSLLNSLHPGEMPTWVGRPPWLLWVSKDPTSLFFFSCQMPGLANHLTSETRDNKTSRHLMGRLRLLSSKIQNNSTVRVLRNHSLLCKGGT